MSVVTYNETTTTETSYIILGIVLWPTDSTVTRFWTLMKWTYVELQGGIPHGTARELNEWMSFNSHLKKISVVQSDRPNRAYMNPQSDSRISPPWCGFVTGSDEEWSGETCSGQGSLVTLGHSIYYINYCSFISLPPPDSPSSIVYVYPGGRCLWCGGGGWQQ